MKNRSKVNFIFVSLAVLLVVGLFVNNSKSKELLGAYIDGEYSDNIPKKDNGYIVEKIVCDNNTVGEWDYDNWGITLTNLSKKAKCNVYFKKGIRLASVNTYVDDTGKCPPANSDGTVNVTGAESENSLLCSAPDNYGTSYYYRGNVQNNYVKFANFYWRIVRINGDNSIRIIYDGTSAHQNGESSEDRIIGKSAFNEKSDDNAYVGYMYGTPDSSTYEETHANINDSTIKKYIDNWYENNLKDTKNEKYLADNIFCNSKKIAYGKGYGKEQTSYFGSYNNNVLYCEKNYSFTIGTSGNKALTYSIGLLTRSETVLAGGYHSNNSSYFLYDGNGTWFMTPISYAEYAIVGDLTSSGNPYGTGCSNTICVLGVKPVINLKPNSLVSGDGTINNPYTVE